MDEESWYSVTPEEIAKYTAELIKGKKQSLMDFVVVEGMSFNLVNIVHKFMLLIFQKRN